MAPANRASYPPGLPLSTRTGVPGRPVTWPPGLQTPTHRTIWTQHSLNTLHWSLARRTCVKETVCRQNEREQRNKCAHNDLQNIMSCKTNCSRLQGSLWLVSNAQRVSVHKGYSLPHAIMTSSTPLTYHYSDKWNSTSYRQSNVNQGWTTGSQRCTVLYSIDRLTCD
jgi:hypothetical protein